MMPDLFMTRWNDQLYFPKPNEEYELPKIIKILVENAINSRKWSLEKTISNIFKRMRERNWHLIPKLIKEMKKLVRFNQINGDQIRKCYLKVSLGDQVNLIINLEKSFLRTNLSFI